MDRITIPEATGDEGMDAKMDIMDAEGCMDDTVQESDPMMPMPKIEEADRLFNERKYEQAFELYRQCADEGDELSKCRMGVMYYDGLGVDKRPLKAFELIKESYDPDIHETVYQLGKCHFEGIGTPVDQELGFELIISVAEEGYPPAENYIAASYFGGDYVEKNVDKALEWLNRAVEHEDPKALYNMGKFLYDGRYVGMNKTRALRLWKKSYQLHFVPALGKMGDYYMASGDHQNEEKGLRCLQKAAECGDGEAAEHIGHYYAGLSKRKDDVEKAIGFFRMALDNGNKDVLYYLGFLYYNNREVMDYEKAFEYFKEGHRNGNMRCSFQYAIMKSRGDGTQEDAEQAFNIFLKCAERGNARSMGWVGHCYRHGIGVNPDDYVAKEWFERGHEKDNYYCTFRLAEFYFRGITVDRDKGYALRLLRRSFRGGETQAAYRLGDIYEKDPDVKSMEDAIFWYMQGAVKNDPQCMMRLAGHYESGAFITRSEEKAFQLYMGAYKEDQSPMAAAEIGRCFEEGIGTDADVKAAIGWYIKASRRNAFAMWRLYNIYIERGEVDRALFWLRRSASRGTVSAMMELAKIYEEGSLVPGSDLRAMFWYHRASDEGNASARTRFQELIQADPQDTEDLDYYHYLTREIGEEGDIDSIIDLAQRLTVGDEVPQDLQKARMWYEIGKELGLPKAKAGLTKVNQLLKAEKTDKVTSDRQTTLDE